MLLENKCKFCNQMLHCSHEFKKLIVCHHKLSFHVAIGNSINKGANL